MKRVFEDKGYWAVILGGSAGIGLATAGQLAASGMNLFIVHRDGRARMKKIEGEFESLRSAGVKVVNANIDAGSEEKMETAVAELKSVMEPNERVRLLLHSVARGNLKPMNASDQPTLNSGDFQLTIDSMALNWYRWAKALKESELFAADARLLAFTSEGSKRAWKGYGAVAAAKATLEALMRNMALEFAEDGLRCNVLQPGITNTTSLQMIPGSDKMIEDAVQRNPFKRLTAPEDVARVIDLMCRDESAWINGAVIPVDGGERISS